MKSRDEANRELMSAVNNNDEAKVQAALNEHADPNLLDSWGGSVLKIAASKGFHKVVKALLDGGANANGVGRYGDNSIANPLYFAISGGHTEVVRTMLSNTFYHVDVNAYFFHSTTPLKYAASSGHLEIVELLLAHGAKPDYGYSSSGGISALSSAAETGQLEVARALIKAGANVNSIEVCRNTPLHAAAENGQLEVVKLLVEHGADISAVNNFGETPANVAASNRHPGVVALLKAAHDQKMSAKLQAKVGSSSLFAARQPSTVNSTESSSAKLLEMMKSRPEEVLAALNSIDAQLAEKLVSAVDVAVKLDHSSRGDTLSM